MKTTIYALSGAVVSVPAIPVVPAVAGLAASHPAGAVRLNGVGVNDAGRGMWRDQPSVGMAAPAGNARTSKLDRTSKLARKATKQFRTTVYEGPRPWKVPV